MPHITTCTSCGKVYEEQSEEAANHPTERLCPECNESLYWESNFDWGDSVGESR